MSDARRYAIWPDTKSRSRAFDSWKSFHFPKLSPLPYTMGAGNWRLIRKLGHNIEIWSGRIIDIWLSFCVTWLWTWQKRQLWRVSHQSRSGLMYWQVGCSSCWLTNSVKTLKETHSEHWKSSTGLILSLSTITLLVEGTLVP